MNKAGYVYHAPVLAKGDVLFWNSLTVHGSLKTTVTGASRRSMTAHYIPETSRYLQFQTRPVPLNLQMVNGMKVHKPKDMARAKTRAMMWAQFNFPKTYLFVRKIAVKLVTG